MAQGGMIKNMVVFATAVTMLMLMEGTTAETLTVGDEAGWRVPSSSEFYPSWAAKHAFAVGDTLVFEFSAKSHTVVKVTSKDAYDKCDSALDKDAKLYEDGPAEITLTDEGQVFFFCTISGHCIGGQKLAINVTAAGSKPLPPAGSQSPPESTTPDKGSSPKRMALTLSTFSLSLVALFMAFGFY